MVNEWSIRKPWLIRLWSPENAQLTVLNDIHWCWCVFYFHNFEQTYHCALVLLLTFWYLLVQDQQWKRQKNVLNLFKVNNKYSFTLPFFCSFIYLFIHSCTYITLVGKIICRKLQLYFIMNTITTLWRWSFL